MEQLRDISISGVLVGFVVVVAASIVLSILSPIIFSQLVQSGDLDILVTEAGPLGYALGVIFVASALGVFTCGLVAERARWIDAILVIALYGAFTYLLSLSPSNQAKPYPDWFVLMSYLVLIPGAIAGHHAGTKFTRKA